MGDLGNVIEATRSAVVGRIVLWRENYHRAILDFCNNIGTRPLCPDVRDHGEYWRVSGRPSDIMAKPQTAPLKRGIVPLLCMGMTRRVA
jgi:hypothetical protein